MVAQKYMLLFKIIQLLVRLGRPYNLKTKYSSSYSILAC